VSVRAAAAFALSCEHVAGAVVVRCTGEVDMSNADQLGVAIETTSAADVIVDLSDLAYLDSSGINAIDQAYRSLRSKNRSFRIVAPPGSAAEWTYRVAGFDPDRLLPTVDHALAALHR